MKSVLAAHPGIDADLDAAAGLAPSLLRQRVRLKLKERKVISGAYKHVDGTSFAAPIVASIAAQMFEANPRLLPHEVKRHLVRTARRIAGVETDRQGWGAVDAEAAVRAALPRTPRASVVETNVRGLLRPASSRQECKGRLAAPLARPAEGPLFGGEGLISGIRLRLG
jgi:subtilisin family serine protease